MMSYQEEAPPGVLVPPYSIYTAYELLYTRASRCYNDFQWNLS
ncbi:hypothetical protein [Clostridium sp. MCC353]|nr:hypothetical protein [Clostridium sp. MCC353]